MGRLQAGFEVRLIEAELPGLRRYARALIGKSEGDTAEVQAPGGVREYEVLVVRYV